MGAAARAFSRLKCVFNDRDLSLKTTNMAYRAVVWGTLAYGAETWVMHKPALRRAEALHNRLMRQRAGISRRRQYEDRITTQDVEDSLGFKTSLRVRLRHRRLSWAGHVARHPEMPAHTVLFGQLLRPRPGRGVRRRYGDQIRTDLVSAGIEYDRWDEVASSRLAWKAALRAAPPPATPSRPRDTVCPRCSRVFKGQVGLDKHSQYCQGGAPNSTVCPDCPFVGSNRAALTNHGRACLRRREDRARTAAIPADLRCTNCERGHRRRSDYSQHVTRNPVCRPAAEARF
jgi:uncharacterized C2H2 Zn-finger protein